MRRPSTPCSTATGRGTTKMSNSALICYTKLSPNHSGNRTHTIDTISIHCMAGNLSVESCGALFAKSSRQASSNYGIGSDGRIALYVPGGVPLLVHLFPSERPESHHHRGRQQRRSPGLARLRQGIPSPSEPCRGHLPEEQHQEARVVYGQEQPRQPRRRLQYDCSPRLRAKACPETTSTTGTAASQRKQ